jgi:hypothetical protein
MFYRSHVPSPPLDRYVEYLWQLSDTPEHARERIVPSGTVELVINLLEDEIRVYDPGPREVCRSYPGAVLSGAFSKSFVIDTREHGRVMGVHFKPGGAAAFMGRLPVHELGDVHVDVQSVWGPPAREFRGRACEATPSSCISLPHNRSRRVGSRRLRSFASIPTLRSPRSAGIA